MEKKRLNFMLPKVEVEILEEYCRLTDRKKTEVMRECIRSLEDKLGTERLEANRQRKERGEGTSG